MSDYEEKFEKDWEAIGKALKNADAVQADLKDLIDIGKDMYAMLVNEMGDNRAHSWAETFISSYWQEKLDIHPPKKYKVLRCSIECSIVVPDCDNSDMIAEDVITNMNFKGCDWEYEVIDDEIDEDDLPNYCYANSETDFEEKDWD